MHNNLTFVQVPETQRLTASASVIILLFHNMPLIYLNNVDMLKCFGYDTEIPN